MLSTEYLASRSWNPILKNIKHNFLLYFGYKYIKELKKVNKSTCPKCIFLFKMFLAFFNISLSDFKYSLWISSS